MNNPSSRLIASLPYSNSNRDGKNNSSSLIGELPSSGTQKNDTTRTSISPNMRWRHSNNSGNDHHYNDRSHDQSNVNINFSVPPSPLVHNHRPSTNGIFSNRIYKGGGTNGGNGQIQQNSLLLSPITNNNRYSSGDSNHSTYYNLKKQGSAKYFNSSGGSGRKSTTGAIRNNRPSLVVPGKGAITSRGRPSFSIEFEHVKKSVLQDDGIDIAERDAVSDEERARRRSQRKAALRRLSEMTRGAFSSEESADSSDGIDSDAKWEVTGKTRTPEEEMGIIKPTKKIIRTISRVHSN